MPKLLRLYIVCVLTGFGIAALLLGVLLWQDVAGLRALILGSNDGLVAALMLFIFNGALFGAVQFAVTVMGMAEPGNGPRGGRGQHLRGPLIPVKVAQGAATKR